MAIEKEKNYHGYLMKTNIVFVVEEIIGRESKIISFL